jgi:dipeptidyl aminopeptidase/acylaminoacyl peptidase
VLELILCSRDGVIVGVDPDDPERQFLIATPVRGVAFAPVASPDGHRIAFSVLEADRDPGWPAASCSVWLSDLHGHLTELPSPGYGGAKMAAWSPDGREVVVENASAGDNSPELKTIATDGSRIGSVTNPGQSPSWGRTNRIAFQTATANAPEPVGSEWVRDVDQYFTDTDAEPPYPADTRAWPAICIATCRPDGSDIRYLLEPNPPDVPTIWTDARAGNQKTPAWSPDGSRIAYLQGPEVVPYPDVDDGLFPHSLWTMAPDGSDRRLVHPNVGMFVTFSRQPISWSPNGKQIVISAGASAIQEDGMTRLGDNGNLGIVDIERGTLRQLDVQGNFPSWCQLPQLPQQALNPPPRQQFRPQPIERGDPPPRPAATIEKLIREVRRLGQKFSQRTKAN